MARRSVEHYGPPSRDEMRRIGAQNMVQDSFRNSPTFKKMTSEAEKMMRDMERAMRQEFPTLEGKTSRGRARG